MGLLRNTYLCGGVTVGCRRTMTDLKCTRCGVEKSYADANIADIHKTCEKEVDVSSPAGFGDTTTVSAEHNWEEIGPRKPKTSWK